MSWSLMSSVLIPAVDAASASLVSLGIDNGNHINSPKTQCLNQIICWKLRILFFKDYMGIKALKLVRDHLKEITI